MPKGVDSNLLQFFMAHVDQHIPRDLGKSVTSNRMNNIFLPLNIHPFVHFTSRILFIVPNLLLLKYILQIIELQTVKELSHIKIQTRVTLEKLKTLALETYWRVYHSKCTHILKMYKRFSSDKSMVLCSVMS